MNDSSSSNTPIAERLKGKVAIITGGASGFGEATTKLFVKHGAKVIIADVQDDKGLSLCNDIASSCIGEDGTSAIYVHCDVTDENNVKNVVDLAISKYGKLDIMFNNAGIVGEAGTGILGTTNENFKNVFDINVYGGFLGAKHAARVMIPRKCGVILFTASIASIWADEVIPNSYSMSKYAILGVMKNLSVEMGQHGIRVNAISPGYVCTPLLTNLFGVEKEVVDELINEASVLKGTTVEAMDVAQGALYLAGDEARFVNGLNLVIDGGFTVTNPSLALATKKLIK